MSLGPQCLEHETIKQHTAMIPEMDRRLTDIHEALMGTMERRGLLSRYDITERIVRWMLGTVVTGAGLLLIAGCSYVWGLIVK